MVNRILDMKKSMAKLLVDIPDELMKKIKLRVMLENISIKESVTRTLESEYGSISSRDQQKLDKIWGKKK